MLVVLNEANTCSNVLSHRPQKL